MRLMGGGRGGLDERLEVGVDGVRAAVLAHELGVVLAVEGVQDAQVGEVREQRPRQVVVVVQPVPHLGRLVVLAPDQRLARLVVQALARRRVERVAVHAPRVGVDPAVADALHDLLGGHVQIEHHVDVHLALELERLVERAREPVQQHPPRVVAELGHDQVGHDVVRDQVPVAHVLDGLAAQRGVLLHLRAQHVAAAQVRESKVLLEPLADGALAAPRRAHDQHVDVRVRAARQGAHAQRARRQRRAAQRA
eukprot:CAMPEP_0202103232 /NCGR_PEP_ID=MMETSP0965-20130614/4771_1 /ASSEMBLY_ACC=CAM_ASM_000507 /TAXON_ID=4773 /ORGANISM="Schizochytrium aggregatum, Strain ATCC28209" /LENGTH=250 /DNA_ID=CAMNT_0048672025 /DNA_START=40 /DNA_END=789 /DNA_ORIENTATION=+